MKKLNGSAFVILAAVASLIFAPAVTAEMKAKPYEKPDDAWISISGTVGAVTRDAFQLDYGKGTITVEMDDGDRDADGYKLLEGDKVTVTGFIDDDLFEARTIEASSVFVEKMDTWFYASGVDEEDTFVTYWSPVVLSKTVVQGTVTEVNDDEFVIHTGQRALRIEVEEMPYDPLDDKGYQKIEIGDRVSVSGTIDDDLFEGRELVADSIIELSS